MRARQTSRQAGRPPAAILLANAAAVAGQFGVMIFGNEVSAADAERRTRRVLLAPYGDWPNQRGLQRFQKEDAQNICNEFQSLAARVATPSSWLGIPWYEGHPDHPDFKGKPGHTRPVAVGRIKKLEAGNEGLWAEVRFNDDGERLISNESYHGHSVNWYMLPDAKDKRAFRPFSLKSVGFTNEPNIPVPAVTTANEAGGRELRFQHMAKLRAAGYGKAQSAANNWSDAAREAALEARRAHGWAHVGSYEGGKVNLYHKQHDSRFGPVHRVVVDDGEPETGAPVGFSTKEEAMKRALKYVEESGYKKDLTRPEKMAHLRSSRVKGNEPLSAGDKIKAHFESGNKLTGTVVRPHNKEGMYVAKFSQGSDAFYAVVKHSSWDDGKTHSWKEQAHEQIPED